MRPARRAETDRPSGSGTTKPSPSKRTSTRARRARIGKGEIRLRCALPRSSLLFVPGCARDSSGIVADDLAAADGAVDGRTEALDDVTVGAETGEGEAEVIAGPLGGGANGVLAVRRGGAEAGHERMAPIVGGV